MKLTDTGMLGNTRVVILVRTMTSNQGKDVVLHMGSSDAEENWPRPGGVCQSISVQDILE